MRPDVPLQRAFGRDRCADQSTIQRTLNALTEENVAQLREAVEAIGRGRWAVFPRLRKEMLTLEVDLTGLRASKSSEGSTKGYFSGKRNSTGRQLVRVSTPDYKEVLFQKLYPGNTTSCEVLKRTIGEVERILGLQEDRTKRQRTLIRLDGGFGTDANLNWLMWRGYEFIAKGYGGKRAAKLAESVPEEGWAEGPTEGQDLGVPSTPHRYARRSKTVVRRWFDEKSNRPYKDYLVSTFTELSAWQMAKLYDARGGMEVDIRGRQAGAGDREEEKKSFHAQEALVLLAQLAHNLLIFFERWLGGTKAKKLGVERLVREVMRMPAEVR